MFKNGGSSKTRTQSSEVSGEERMLLALAQEAVASGKYASKTVKRSVKLMNTRRWPPTSKRLHQRALHGSCGDEGLWGLVCHYCCCRPHAPAREQVQRLETSYIAPEPEHIAGIKEALQEAARLQDTESLLNQLRKLACFEFTHDLLVSTKIGPVVGCCTEPMPGPQCACSTPHLHRPRLHLRAVPCRSPSADLTSADQSHVSLPSNNLIHTAGSRPAEL